MQRYAHLFGRFLCLVLLFVCIFSVPSHATSDTIIDIEHTSDGYFSIYYFSDDSPKMKIGVTFDNKTVYHDYVVGETSSYAFTQGSGTYTISIYRNIKGALYKRIVSKKVVVELENSFSPYLISANEITFSNNDDVCKKAAEICEGLTDNASKMAEIYSYIYTNISYDHDLAESIKSGKTKTYRPNAVNTLNVKKGICYDYSVLFAAMCRSQGIPCCVEKGYYKNIYHSWNKVYVDNLWYEIDSTTMSQYDLKNKFFIK